MTHWLISGRGQGRLFQKMMKMSNQDLRIMLGNFMELNTRPSPKFPALVFLPHFAPAKHLLVGEDPGCICSDAISSLSLGAMAPACPSPAPTSSQPKDCGADVSWDISLADGKRGHLEKRPEGSCGSLLMGREAGNTRVREGPPLVAGLDSPLSSLGRMGYLSSPGPLRFGRAAEAV